MVSKSAEMKVGWMVGRRAVLLVALKDALLVAMWAAEMAEKMVC